MALLILIFLRKIKRNLYSYMGILVTHCYRKLVLLCLSCILLFFNKFLFLILRVRIYLRVIKEQRESRIRE